tara:strand:+ start:2776 stop:3225 length:450 start_codon:yes stop_codon:yes gene_type:complete
MYLNRKKKNPFHKKRTSNYRSGLEENVINNLKQRNVNFKYEQRIINYFKPSTKHKYTPDVELDNGILIEIKGFFKREDRKKHLLVKEQNPKLDIRFIFGNSKNKIYKGSKTSYADWCLKHEFVFADKVIPTDWITRKDYENTKINRRME